MKFGLQSCVALLAFFCAVNAEGDDLRRLRYDLFVKNKYDKLSRPVKDWRKTTAVYTGITITRIGNLDATERTLEVDAWMQYTWQDDHLQWTPIEYGGITIMRLDSDELWKPDLVVYNGADIEANDRRTFKTQALIYSNGKVMWIPPVRLQTTCDIDLRLYPRDTQTCNITIGSWTYDASSLNITVSKVGVLDDDTTPIYGQWKLTKNATIRRDKVYACCPGEVYPSLTYSLSFQRRNPLSCLTIKLPQRISFLFTLLSFWIPARCLKGRLVVTALAMLFAHATIYYIANEVGSSATRTPYAVLCSGTLVCLAGFAMALAVVTNRVARKALKLPSSCQYTGSCPITKWICRHAEKAAPSLTQEKVALDDKSESSHDAHAEQAAFCLDRIFFACYVILAVVTHIVLALR